MEGKRRKSRRWRRKRWKNKVKDIYIQNFLVGFRWCGLSENFDCYLDLYVLSFRNPKSLNTQTNQKSKIKYPEIHFCNSKKKKGLMAVDYSDLEHCTKGPRAEHPGLLKLCLLQNPEQCLVRSFTTRSQWLHQLEHTLWMHFVPSNSFTCILHSNTEKGCTVLYCTDHSFCFWKWPPSSHTSLSCRIRRTVLFLFICCRRSTTKMASDTMTITKSPPTTPTANVEWIGTLWEHKTYLKCKKYEVGFMET